MFLLLLVVKVCFGNWRDTVTVRCYRRDKITARSSVSTPPLTILRIQYLTVTVL